MSKVARENGILLMMCDQCAVRRNLAAGTLEQCGKGEMLSSGGRLSQTVRSTE